MLKLILYLILSYFNTSHVNVNHKYEPTCLQYALISIHLMLMLIIYATCIIITRIYFNTSHVNVNRSSTGSLMLLNIDFNTSHVNVNPVENKEDITEDIFQYISC